jgi:hypothetical protein
VTGVVVVDLARRSFDSGQRVGDGSRGSLPPVRTRAAPCRNPRVELSRLDSLYCTERTQKQTSSYLPNHGFVPEYVGDIDGTGRISCQLAAGNGAGMVLLQVLLINTRGLAFVISAIGFGGC